MPKVYILLPVHNRREITRSFVECLAAQTFTNYHLVLIDDGSTDGTAEMVQERIPSTTVLRGDGSWWWAGSLQQGLNWLKQSRTEDKAIVLVINDDVRFAPDYLDRAVRLMAGRIRTLLLSRFRKPQTGEVQETGVIADLRRLRFTVASSADRVNCLSTRGLFAYWEDIRTIGGFHPTLLPHYLSDYEYTMRAHRKGFKCETNADLFIEPNLGATGFHEMGGVPFAIFLQRFCSKKSTVNPFYWSSFVLLASEPMWVIPNLFRVWFRASKVVINACWATRRAC